MAVPGISISPEAEVPWATSLYSLFEQRPASPGRVIQPSADDPYISITPDIPERDGTSLDHTSTEGFNLENPSNVDIDQPTESTSHPVNE